MTKEETGRIVLDGLGNSLRFLRDYWFLVLIIGGWILRVELFVNAGPRFTVLDAQLLKAEIVEELPPKSHLRDHEQEQAAMQRELGYIKEKVDENSARIAAVELELKDVGKDVAVIRRILEN